MYEWRCTQMFTINSNCVSCGLCAANCPVDAIAQGDEHYVINQDTCVQCGSCQMNCPADAVDREG